MAPLVTLDDVLAARELLSGVIRPTPLEPSRGFPPHAGERIFYKCENVQRAGAYKVRGAYVRIARLTDAERARGVVAASAGNHAQGVALAAGLLGAKSTVFMPSGAPIPKVAATKGYGATVELVGQTVDDALDAARDFAERSGAVFIHPFDHPDVIAGQGTVALEILEQLPDVKTIITGVGGGGLVSGIGVVVKALRPDVRVIGVQAEGAAAFPPSLAENRLVRLPSVHTIADGIKVSVPGQVTFEHVRHLVDEVVTVSDEDISHALLRLLERSKLVVEPAGAVGVATLLADPERFEGPVCVILSGGNIDPLLMLRVIEHGLTAAGRFLRFTVRCTDRPGVLAAILGLIARAGGNVLDVMHQRHNPGLHLGEVAVELSVETRGDEHSARLTTELESAGYQLDFVRPQG
ncbi:threonine ammonia-lyase [Actinorhabdospora filicis]|uniref:threonine ammonia-lyase n=1 Tax=Actinorhabdospora filicis TaxID=1785913 RepID=A0A9W6SHI8_9ACTN|nr:threonine ammonia-lyase [Actinorhabdospora filicis]GLZ76398.1 threonine ammonia-lyase [Actinorhabdospora filicis]